MRHLPGETCPEPGALHGRPLASVGFVRTADIRARRVLAVGCGVGWFERWALAHGAAVAVGCDLGGASLAVARRDVTGAGFARADGLALPFPARAFDAVACWEVVEHVPSGAEPALLAEVRRVLRPGGVCYLSTPNAHPVATALDPAWWLAGHRHYRAARLVALARAAGFSVERRRAVGRCWWLLALLDLYCCKWLLRRPPLAGAWLARREDAEAARPGYANLFLRLVAA